MVQHTLPLVSFSADVKRGKNQEIFSYIAKTSPKAKEYICYAYEVPRGQVRHNYRIQYLRMLNSYIYYMKNTKMNHVFSRLATNYATINIITLQKHDGCFDLSSQLLCAYRLYLINLAWSYMHKYM